MNTQKVAITIPRNLVVLIDDISKKHGMSRSKYIASVLNEKLMEERSVQLTAAYNALFSDEKIAKEQLDTAKAFESAGNEEGQEW
jgi:metal-responsive CopG/Arc/MetJ family transcriptional regulator